MKGIVVRAVVMIVMVFVLLAVMGIGSAEVLENSDEEIDESSDEGRGNVSDASCMSKCYDVYDSRQRRSGCIAGCQN